MAIPGCAEGIHGDEGVTGIGGGGCNAPVFGSKTGRGKEVFLAEYT